MATLSSAGAQLSPVMCSFVSLALSTVSDTNWNINKFLEKEERKGEREREGERGRQMIEMIELFRILVMQFLCCPGTELCPGEEVSLS